MIHYDRDGEIISFEAWALLFENKDYQVLKQTKVDGILVSTVWLGLDHSFGFGGPPLIFETMVFGWEEDEVQRRYTTEADALADHDEIVESIEAVVR